MSVTAGDTIVLHDGLESVQHPRARAPAQPWTLKEDGLLRAAVAKYGEDTDSWKRIAEEVPGRTNKSCRKRWKHSLSPTLKKTAWTKEEDELLLTLHAKYPCRWSMIAKHISGRTDDACAKRYREALDPSIKQGEWTPEEDEKLLREYRRWGGRWASVAVQLGRSGLGCRNRWRLLERKKVQASSRVMRSSATHTEDSDTNCQQTPEQAQKDSNAFHAITTSQVTCATDNSLWIDDLLAQIRQDPFAFENLFLDLDSTIESDNSVPLDPALPGVNASLTYPQTQFDPRLLDLMQGGCGCGCSSRTGCECTDEGPPPFLSMSSQEFLGPFHHMSQLLLQFDDSPVLPSSAGNPNTHTPAAPLDISLVPLDSADDQRTTSSTHSPVNRAFSASSFQLSSEPPSLLPDSHPQSTVERSPPTSKPIEDAPGRPSSIGHSPTPGDATPPTHRHVDNNMSTCLASKLPDRSRWNAQQALLALSRAKEKPSCKCSGPCCSVPSGTAGSLCSGKALKRSRSSTPRDDDDPNLQRQMKIRKLSMVPSVPRLSSQLPLMSQTDEQLLAYACGHSSCWVSDNEIKSRFDTSGELLDHYRKTHGDLCVNSENGGRAFRCALQGCGKGWKSINGIQYHLQLSKAHFSMALNKHILLSDPEAEPTTCCQGTTDQGPAGDDSALDISGQNKSSLTRRKTHACPHFGCPNVYKQAAGLKYHLAHGHPDQPPLQLGSVPPALVQKLSQKVQRA